MVVSDEFVGDDEHVYEIDTDDGGLEVHCVARVDGICEIKHSDDDFVTLLQSDARFEVLEVLEELEVSVTREEAVQPGEPADASTRQVRDERIELAETGEKFRRIVLETPDGEKIEYLTTLASSAYDPIDVISIYTLRTMIEILFRELKQYLNIENFHSKSLNGVLFELFCALIGYVLVMCRCIPVI